MLHVLFVFTRKHDWINVLQANAMRLGKYTPFGRCSRALQDVVVVLVVVIGGKDSRGCLL